MKTLIIYDSMFGNTKQIAEAIAGTFVASDTRIINVSDAKPEDLNGIEMLIVGAPTYGGRPKPSTQAFLDSIPAETLAGVGVAAFDTRFAAKDQNIALRLLMKVIDFAAPRIAKALVEKGGKLAVPAEGFFVLGKEGPVKEGELARAAAWARKMS
jgi:flavodoxin